MNKLDIVKKLDVITDNAAISVLKRAVPLEISDDFILVGNLSVRKNINGFYDVYNFNTIKLYENIILADIAILLAQKYNFGKTNIINKILHLENTYAKYHLDMVHYLNCMKSSKKRKDYERLAILEDKFRVAEQRAKRYKKMMLNFKSAF